MMNFQNQYLLDEYKRRQMDQANSDKSHANVVRQFIQEQRIAQERRKRR